MRVSTKWCACVCLCVHALELVGDTDFPHDTRRATGASQRLAIFETAAKARYMISPKGSSFSGWLLVSQAGEI